MKEQEKTTEKYAGQMTARLARLIYKVTYVLEKKDKELSENGYDLQNPFRQGFMLAESLISKTIDELPVTPPQSATVEEADLNRLATDAIRAFPPVTGHPFEARIRSDMWKAGYNYAHQSKPIEERHWEMEPLEMEGPMTEQARVSYESLPQQLKDGISWEDYLLTYKTETIRNELYKVAKPDLTKVVYEVPDEVKQRLKHRLQQPETMGGNEEVIQNAITVLMRIADGEAITGDEAKEAGFPLHNLMIEQRQSQPQWIETERELPKESGRYLCYVEEINDLGKSYFVWNCSFNKDDVSKWTDGLQPMRVTHWQPLPEPPATK